MNESQSKAEALTAPSAIDGVGAPIDHLMPASTAEQGIARGTTSQSTNEKTPIPSHDNIAARGGAWGALFLGVWSIIGAWITPWSIVNAIIGLLLAPWGFASKRKLVAALGVVLCLIGAITSLGIRSIIRVFFPT